MEKKTLILAQMMRDLPAKEKDDFIFLLDKCSVLDMTTLSERERKTGRISDRKLKKYTLPRVMLVLKLKEALIRNNSELNNNNPAADALTMIVGQGVMDYLYMMTATQKNNFKNMVLGKTELPKSLKVSSRIRQNIKD